MPGHGLSLPAPVITYGRQRRPLSPRNAAIAVARMAPAPMLAPVQSSHPRDLRLAQRRSEASAGLLAPDAAVPPAVPPHERLLETLRLLADDCSDLPAYGELAAAIGATLEHFYAAVQQLKRRGELFCTTNRGRHRAWRLADGRELRTPGCPEEISAPSKQAAPRPSEGSELAEPARVRLLRVLHLLADRCAVLPTGAELAEAISCSPGSLHLARHALRRRKELFYRTEPGGRRVWRLADGRELRGPGGPDGASER